MIVLVSSQSFGQSEPDKEITIEYVNKIMNDTEGYDQKNINGHEYIIHSVSFYSFALIIDVSNQNTAYCSTRYYYDNINWAKVQSIDLETSASISSPVKFLIVNFVPNSILWKGRRYDEKLGPNFRSENCNDGVFEISKSISSIRVPYRDEEGVRERLIKALNHLSKLEKEEQAKNDPFGN